MEKSYTYDITAFVVVQKNSKLGFYSYPHKVIHQDYVKSRALPALDFVADSTKKFTRLCKYDLLNLSFMV